MREIKFRAWTKIYCYKIIPDKEKGGSKWTSKKLMCEVSSIHTKKKTVRVLHKTAEGYNGSANKKFDEIELMQYIGLKGIKGKEVYEGDIVTAKAYPFYGDAPEIKGKGECKELNYVGVVTYDNENLSYFLDMKKVSNRVSGDVMCLDVTDYDLEVIGNIYENKDLIEEMGR